MALYILCIIGKLPRLAIIKGFGLNRCNVKSVTSESSFSELNTRCLEAGDVSHGYKSPCQILLQKLAWEGVLWIQMQNTKANNDLRNWLDNQGFTFYVPL